MKISTKGRYGLEAMVDLAVHSTHGHVSIKSISERCGVSEAYILQLFLKLRRSGLVESIRGAQGGYVLARDPSSIKVLDVLAVLEGPFAPVPCMADESCEQHEKCATREVWKKIAQTLIDVANSVTIDDLVACYEKEYYANKEPEYYL